MKKEINNTTKKETNLEELKLKSFNDCLKKYGGSIADELLKKYKKSGAAAIVPNGDIKWITHGKIDIDYIFKHYPMIKKYYDEDEDTKMFDKESLTKLLDKYYIYRMDDFSKNNKRINKERRAALEGMKTQFNIEKMMGDNFNDAPQRSIPNREVLPPHQPMSIGSLSHCVMIITEDINSKYGVVIKIQYLDKPDEHILPIDEIKNKNSKLLHNIIKAHENKSISVISMYTVQRYITLNNETYDEIIGLLDDVKRNNVGCLFMKFKNNLAKSIYEKNKSINNSLVPLFEIMSVNIFRIMLSNDRFKTIYDNIDKYALFIDDIKYLISEFYKDELDFINSDDFDGTL